MTHRTTGEGWQAEGAHTQRRWHYIRGTKSICGKFGFYFGEIVDGGLKPGGPDDCAECKRRVQRELDSTSDGSGS